MITAEQYHKQLTSIQATFATKPLDEQITDFKHILLTLQPYEMISENTAAITWLKSDANRTIRTNIDAALTKQAEEDARTSLLALSSLSNRYGALTDSSEVKGETDYLRGWLKMTKLDGNEDVPAGAAFYKASAHKGFAEAQSAIGQLHYYGDGMPAIDHKEAVKWFRAAARQGHVEGQFSLGLCYLRGEGTDKNVSKAIKWFTKAAEQGYKEAVENLPLLRKEHEAQQSREDGFTLTLNFDTAANCAKFQDHLTPIIAAENEQGVSTKPTGKQSFAITYPSHIARLAANSASSSASPNR